MELLFDVLLYIVFCFFFNDTATTEIYTLSLHDALPIYSTLYQYRRGNEKSGGTAGTGLALVQRFFVPAVFVNPCTGLTEAGTRIGLPVQIFGTAFCGGHSSPGVFSRNSA